MILKNFVVFEGLDGTGTTSQIRLLQEAFASRGRQDAVLFTCEPTDGSIGKLIREALSGTVDFDAQTIAYLFGADRCEHIHGKEGILAQLRAGKAVFSDRYLFSSLAYQGLAAGKNWHGQSMRRFRSPNISFSLTCRRKLRWSESKNGISRGKYTKKRYFNKR